MPSTKPTTNGVAPPSSATAKKRAFIPSVVNPYAEFTQPQFDAFVSDITMKIRDALHSGRKKDKGKGKDMSLFGGDISTTSVEQGDAMGFEQFSFSTKVRNGLNGSSPLDAAHVLTDEEEQDEDTEREEQEEVNGYVEKQVLRPASDERQEPSEPPQVIIQGAGGADDPIVIDLLDSDEEEPQVNGICDMGDQEESQCEEESNDEEEEDENVPGQQPNNSIVIDSDEESEYDEEQRLLFPESHQLNTSEVQIEGRVEDPLPASSPAPDDQDDEEEHIDDAELDHMHTAYESFVANISRSGSAMPYAEGPDLNAEASGYSSEIIDPYYSLYPYDNTTQDFIDPSNQSANRARQKSRNEEGMSWTYPPAFPPRSNSVSGHRVYQNQSEEPHHQVFPVSTDGYGIPTSVISSYANIYTADGYAPLDETQYHSAYQAEQSVQRLPMDAAELTSRVPFDNVDIYADLAIDPSLDTARAVSDVPQSTSIEGIQSDVHMDVPAPASDESGVVEGVVEESSEIPTIEIDVTNVDPLSLETTTFGTGTLASMLTPDLRHLMELPSPTSPTVDLFPMHEKSRDHQISEANLVDSEQLLTPDGAVRPLQELGSLEQAVPNMPAARSPTPASPTTEPVFKNSQVFIETLKAEVDTQEQALTVPVTDPAAQNATASLLISATSAEPLESEPSAFTFDEESQAFGHTDEKFEFHSIRGSSVLSGEYPLDPFEQDATISPQRRETQQDTSSHNSLNRELRGLQDGAGAIVLDGPRLRRTTSLKSGVPPAANASVRGRGRGEASKQPSPRKRASTPVASMPPPSGVPKRNRVLRGSSRASSAASDQSVQKPSSKSPSLDYRSSPSSPSELRLDTALRTKAPSSAGSTPTTKKRKRRLSIKMLEDNEDYVPEEVEQAHKKRKIEIHDPIEADPSLASVDLGEALAVAEGTPDLKTKGAIGDEGSPRKRRDPSPSTLQARIAIEDSAGDDERYRSTTQINDEHTDSDLTPLRSGGESIKTHEASSPSPSKHTPKRRSKPMDSQHTSYKPLSDAEESESEGESSHHKSVRRIRMQNGYRTEVEEPVQDTKRSTPTYEEISDGSSSDISDSEGSWYGDTVGSTEESTTIVEGATEEPEVDVYGLDLKPKLDRQKSRRMRRIQRDNLAFKPSPSSESEGDVEQLLEQEEMKERRRRRLRALRKARRTREKKAAAVAGGNVVDGDISIKSRKRKRPSEHVNEHEHGKSKGIQVKDSVDDSGPKKKRVKKDYPANTDQSAPITNGVQKSDRALQVRPIESDLGLAEPPKPPDQVDLKLVSHKSVVPDVPLPITNEIDKSKAGVGWFGRLFAKKSI